MPTDEQRALWAAIRAHPDEDTPRLVYADWLQEHGDEPRAEFIRVQCALERLGPDRRKGRKERPALEAKERELLAQYRDMWWGELRRALPDRPSTVGQFQRGFYAIDYLWLDAIEPLVETGETLEPVAVRQVSASGDMYRPARITALAQWPGAAMIRTLALLGAGNEALTAVTTNGQFRTLSILSLPYGSISDTGMRELARWPFAIELRRLSLRNNPITHAGAFALAESPHLSGLEQLDLCQTRINTDGRRVLRERFGNKLHIEPEPV